MAWLTVGAPNWKPRQDEGRRESRDVYDVSCAYLSDHRCSNISASHSLTEQWTSSSGSPGQTSSLKVRKKKNRS